MTSNPRPDRTDRLPVDERAVSELIGAIFVFALIIMVLALLQLWAVPAATQQAEFDHNQRALADMQSIGSDVDRAASLGTVGSSTFEIGPQYTRRLFLLNPPAPAGTLETAEGEIHLEHAVAHNAETADYLDGSPVTFDTRSLTYRPNYNEYANAPTTRYEGWTMYNEFEETNIVLGGRSPISGDRISLTALDGRQSTSAGGTLSIQTTPVSAPSRTVSITGTDGEDIVLDLTTGLDQEDWESILADEMGPEGNVVDVDVDESDGRVTITLDGTETYDLRMAKVGIGPGTTDEGAHYLTTTATQPALDASGGTVTIQVRDRFNNPVPGVEVDFEGVGITIDDTVTSDEDGLATARFQSHPGVDRTTITASATVNPDPPESEEARGTVEFVNVPVRQDVGTDTSHSEINPTGGDTIEFVSAEARNIGTGTGAGARWVVDLTFYNHGDATSLDETRFNAYIRNTFSASERIVIPHSAEFGNEDIGFETHTMRGSYVVWDDAELQPGTNEFVVEFHSSDGSNFNPNNGDFFMLTVNTGGEDTSRYFIQVSKN